VCWKIVSEDCVEANSFEMFKSGEKSVNGKLRAM
jgi:hypothetical protein